MKFLTRINRNYLILFSITLIGVTIVGYFALHLIIMRGAKENLLSKEYLIEKQIKNTGEIPNLNPLIVVTKTDEGGNAKPSFKEVKIWNELEKENEVFLEYSNCIKVNNTYYLIKLRRFAFENEDLVLVLAIAIFILLLSAFLISFFITRRLNKTVWAEFEHNLHAIESFSLDLNKNISLIESDTEEFERLNKVINNLTEKLKTDYLMLKEFTENAAHEIQTPLSIALINLEEILQHDLKEETFQKMVASISALKRLSSLNQSLILLAKIENKQFIFNTEISVNEIFTRKIQEFSVLFETKALEVKIQSENDFKIGINKQLAEIMIGNLLSNAINHNVNNGNIRIYVNSESFRICNTGESNLFTNDTIFNRFVSGNSRSYGLGLAIVKKICETHNLDIHYTRDDLHCFTIKQKS